MLALPTLFVFVFTSFLGTGHGKSIDQIIMEAAPMDTSSFQMDPGGEVYVMKELDMKLTIKQYTDYMGHSDARQKRKAINDDNYRWKNCEVHYRIEGTDFDTREMAVIREALNEWANYTCLEFKPPTANINNTIVFQRGSGGCYSRLGMIGGPQEIGLSRGCVYKGVVIHEIGHAIGWIHEQARPDRDQHIRVNFNIIPRNWHDQFDKFPTSLINYYKVPYDYTSIMHYGGNAVVPRSIVTSNPKYQDVIGQREGLSFRDVMLANRMYDCANIKCPSVKDKDCSRFGQDAFVYMLNGQCDCVCPGESEAQLLMFCEPKRHTMPPSTTPSVTSLPTLESTTPGKMECKDMRPGCVQEKAKGACRTDTAAMQMYCMKTCDFCDKGEMCMDYDSSCPLLALGNFCNNTAFQSIMTTKCRRSCKFCKPMDPCEMAKSLGLDQPQSSAAVHTSFIISTAILAILSLLISIY